MFNKNAYFSNMKLLSKDSEFFPKNLFQLSDCPDILFVLGNEKILNNFSVSIVGTRNSSQLGNEIAFNISKNLSFNHITIVSGMASGIDTQAHLGAISRENNYTSSKQISNAIHYTNSHLFGNTIAIIACGFNHIFTPKNKILIKNIIENGGVIISEYFPDTPPQNFTFLRRNRLVAAISKALIVIEAPLKSGALNTAQIAINLNKPLFVIPWNINISRGQGCNFLLKNGATLLTDHSQILDFLKITNCNNSLTNQDFTNNKIYDIPQKFIKLYTYIAKYSPLTKEQIYTHFKEEPIANINSNLILMELQNFITFNRYRIFY